jgi:DNA polymerase-3 subunit delta
MHVTAFLRKPEGCETGPIVVLSGKVGHLKQAAIKLLAERLLGSEGELGLTRFAGNDADLRSVCDELRTVSMWGDRRMVVVDEADDFVSNYRSGLEKYLEQPARKSVLVLDVKSFPKTTRLAKVVAKIGLPLECTELSAGELARWLVDESKATYGKQLSRESAQLMIDLAGAEIGLLDQELAKLAAYVGDRPKIEPDDVRALVGGWKAQTTWAMTDAVRDGRLDEALACLDKLLGAGEAPQKILGGINYVFRKYAQATEHARHTASLNAALQQSGVFPRDVAVSAQYLRRIGRPQAERLFEHLQTADSRFKGTLRLPERIVLEQLLLALGGRT